MLPQQPGLTRHYNSLLQLTEQFFGAGFYDLKYIYSPNQNNGRILQQLETTSGETTNYTYDSLNRLATASTGAWGQSFTYDGFGNLTDKNVTAGSAPTLHVTVNPANNRISTASYDLNGNLLYFQAGTSYVYDQENRLASFVTATTESYSYGPGNERIWRRKLDGTQEVYFYGATGERLATYQLGGPIAEVGRNIYFAGRPVSLAGYQNQYQPYVGMDRLGTVRWSGDYQYHTTKFSYYPYGEEYTTSAQEREKFGTYYRDGSTGLDYARNRYYASTYGRFMTADPSGGSADPAEPGSWNRYAYVNGDPVNSNDPSGLDPEGGPPPSGCYFNGFWIPGCDIGGPMHFMPQTAWSKAIQRLSAAVDAVGDRSNVSIKCQKDLDALSAAAGHTIGLGAIQGALASTYFKNGVTSTLPVSALFGQGAEAAGTAFQHQQDAQFGPGQTIGNEFARNPRGLTADSVLLGSTIFINPALIGSSLSNNEGLLFHEALHELGLIDQDIQKALGYKDFDNVSNTKRISTRLQQDCINGKGNN